MPSSSGLLVLLTDDSSETSQAMVKLTSAKVRFVPMPVEGRGPILLSKRRTFRGLEGIQRYLDEKRQQPKKVRQLKEKG
jgi:hypothetical protein